MLATLIINDDPSTAAPAETTLQLSADGIDAVGTLETKAAVWPGDTLKLTRAVGTRGTQVISGYIVAVTTGADGTQRVKFGGTARLVRLSDGAFYAPVKLADTPASVLYQYYRSATDTPVYNFAA